MYSCPIPYQERLFEFPSSRPYSFNKHAAMDRSDQVKLMHSITSRKELSTQNYSVLLLPLFPAKVVPPQVCPPKQ
jgi:hypothetical protein